MMKHLTFTVIMTIAILSCKEQSKENSQNQNLDSEQSTLEEVSSEPKVNTDFVKTFEGQINNKYDIVMKLTSNNGRINGEYFYKSKGVSLSLSGDVEENGKIIMNEFDDNGNQTGMFEGIMVNENKIQGKWSKPDGSNEEAIAIANAISVNFKTLAI